MDLTTSIIKEACVETLAQAIKAESLGADQIELCARLDLDGLTPSRKLIMQCQENLSIPIKVMIRPRMGNFIYNTSELQTMISSIMMCQDLGIQAIVLGALNEDNTTDINAINTLADSGKTMHITFHKAIDLTPDPLVEIDKLKAINNISAILSSGKGRTAWEGRNLLIAMKKSCGNSLELIVAGKVSKMNLGTLHGFLNAKSYHGKQIVGNLT